MASGYRRGRIALMCFFVVTGFIAGCWAARRIVVSPTLSARQAYLESKGNAPADARAGVLESLREFQAGYSRRDMQKLDGFMQRLFPRDQDARVIGTEVNEWRNGNPAIARLVLADWLSWGDLRLVVNDSVVDSFGDVAWVATAGSVEWPHSSRAIRFTAVLTRQDRNWVFRQIVFQWDERPVTFFDLTKHEAQSSIHLR